MYSGKQGNRRDYQAQIVFVGSAGDCLAYRLDIFLFILFFGNDV